MTPRTLGLRTCVVEGGYPHWRSLALAAIDAGLPPDAVTWIDQGQAPGAQAGDAQMGLAYAGEGDSGGETADPSRLPTAAAPAKPGLRVSKAFAQLLQEAALYRSPQRWSLLYRALWRWAQGDRSAASAADEDGARLNAMSKAVRRAHHDMIAYLRFRRREPGGVPEYVAWYAPDHDVLASAADHFARRMGSTSWWIATPQGAALWDGRTLTFSPVPADAPALQADAQDDQIEPLWLVYYKSIFNPARLNETALQQRMPVRFWKGLPEGPLIPGLVAEARNGARRDGQADAVGQMRGKTIAIEHEAAQPQRAAPSTLEDCRRCELWRHATQAVPGEGPPSARLMLIGEQPGDHEDLSGRAFIGPAGQVLDEALAQAGVARDSVYLTNAVKHFKWEPRGKQRLHKTPGQREVEACSHWLQEEVQRLRPAVIVTLGATALKAVLGPKASLQAHLGQPLRVGDSWVIATWHPSYALRVQGGLSRADVVAGMTQALRLGQLHADGAAGADGSAGAPTTEPAGANDRRAPATAQSSGAATGSDINWSLQ